MKPRIGVSVWKRALKTWLGDPEILHSLSDHYVEAIRGAGGIPILIPPLHPDDAPTMLAALDGLLISGGGDVDPISYGDVDRGGNYDMNAAVDAWEISLINEAADKGLPFLGICRGMQVLNVAFGGTLAQEIGDSDGVHLPVKGDPEDLLKRRHTVTLEPGSKLASIYGTDQRSVNTLHHQAPAEVSAELEVVARSGDGLVEGLEYPGDWYAVAVQWHPERLDSEDEAPLFKDFVKQATIFRNHRGG